MYCLTTCCCDFLNFCHTITPFKHEIHLLYFGHHNFVTCAGSWLIIEFENPGISNELSLEKSIRLFLLFLVFLKNLLAGIFEKYYLGCLAEEEYNVPHRKRGADSNSVW